MRPFSKILRSKNKNIRSSKHDQKVNRNFREAWPDTDLPKTADIKHRLYQSVSAFLDESPFGNAIESELLSSYCGSDGIKLNTGERERDYNFNAGEFPKPFFELQRQIARSWLRHGEVLCIINVPQMLTVHITLLNPNQRDLNKQGMNIREGIEYDANGNEVAMWIKFPVSNQYTIGYINHQPKRIPWENVIFFCEEITPGVRRGKSPLTSILPIVDQLEKIYGARLKQIQTSALFGGVYISPEGESLTDNSEDFSLEPGGILNLAMGSDFKTVNPSASPDFDQHIKRLLKTISASVGITYEALSGDLSDTNYSSYRGGALISRRKAEATRNLVLKPILGEIYRLWEAVKIENNHLSESIEPQWIDPAWPEVDPLKSANADIALLQAGLKSRSEIIASRGRDPETVVSEIVEDPIQRMALEEETKEKGEDENDSTIH